MTKPLVVLALASLSAIAACGVAGTTTADPQAPRTQTIHTDLGGDLRMANVVDASSTPINAAPEDAYQLMPAVYDTLGIPKTWLEPKQFLISSQGFKARARLGKTPLSKFINCGSTQIGPNADTYDIFMTVTTKLLKTESGSNLSTTVEAAARPLSFNQPYSACSSRGELEARIGIMLKAMLARK